MRYTKFVRGAYFCPKNLSAPSPGPRRVSSMDIRTLIETELLGTDHSLAAFRIAWVADSRERQGSAEESGRVGKESVEQGLTET